MSIIVNVEIPTSDFELDRILSVLEHSRVELEAVVPLEGKAVPLFWLYEAGSDDLIEDVRSHENVFEIEEYAATTNRNLYAFVWNSEADDLLNAILEHGGHLLEGEGSGRQWTFQIRFPNRQALSAFADTCREREVDLRVGRIYSPSHAEENQRFGLSDVQRETLVLAVEEGYFEIPRQISTRELGDKLGVSDQAVTARLRRATRTLTENTLLAHSDDGDVHMH
ncbi:helix-turn-helix domain-containing protein [Halapricum hydrolyticum]|uniref:Helix-turn-helix domain-containing protein n=1 Tax=Halapricum hydrolyticum TaxID=2979991 RepID=A0AAE3IDL3_9EURY|nr:helix-turn-helix domain-containing protein [Halapricum hydrolyticum]MCU4719455.1 helix-turn-helix domain-containing protein [Halapricum hydrolyticum]MCU4728066.1 helix-turn-helix domain-containing protein [Halapricum hydrolyticum]